MQHRLNAVGLLPRAASGGEGNTSRRRVLQGFLRFRTSAHDFLTTSTAEARQEPFVSFLEAFHGPVEPVTTWA